VARGAEPRTCLTPKTVGRSLVSPRPEPGHDRRGDERAGLRGGPRPAPQGIEERRGHHGPKHRLDILVVAQNAICTACFTSIPSSRISTLNAEGVLIEGCEMCGAIIYLPEVMV